MSSKKEHKKHRDSKKKEGDDHKKHREKGKKDHDSHAHPDKSSKPLKNELDEPDLIIDTTGKPTHLPLGGKLLLQPFEVKDTAKKPSQFSIEVFLDANVVYKSKSPTNGLSWKLEDPLQTLDIPEDCKTLKVVLKEKGLVGLAFKGEVRLDMEALLDSYPHFEWYDLHGKEGKEASKVVGAMQLKVHYLGKGEPNLEVFKYPLHGLINTNRLDIFQRKLDELKLSSYTPNDKKLTPLLHAAAEGKVGFVKVLIENKADFVQERGGYSRNALHLGAVGGHVDVVRYLSSVGGVDLNAPDSSEFQATALHLAAEKDFPEVIKWLVKGGADINARNIKGNTPLAHILMMQPESAPHAIAALVEMGADIYIKNNDGNTVWEIANKRELCYVITSRNAFMKATDTIDYREFLIMQFMANKQRFEGKNMSKDWGNAQQFIFTVDEPTKVSMLVYPNSRTENCEKQVAFCLVKGTERKYKAPSFQQDGIGFASLKAFEFELQPEFSYTAITYCMDDAVAGDFGICVFTKKGAKPVHGVIAEDWPQEVKAHGEWKDESAGGSADELMDNMKFVLKNKDKSKAEVLVMLRQINKTIDSLSLADGGHRITPSKYYVGFYVYDVELEKEIDRTDKWINSYDVYKTLTIESGESVVIIPCTQKEGEEMEFEIHAFSAKKIELKRMEE